MIGVLAVAGVTVLLALVAVGGVTLHRDLTQIADQVARSGHQPEFSRWLDRVWAEVQQWQDAHAEATVKRLRDIEVAVTQARQDQSELSRYVNWLVPVVEHWQTRSGGNG